jgi:hypothetical protein
MTRRFAVDFFAAMARGGVGEHGRGHVGGKTCCGVAPKVGSDEHLTGLAVVQ